MHKKERKKERKQTTFRNVTTRERWVISTLLIAGLWLALGVGPAVGAPAGEDMAAKAGCPTCKVLGSETVVLPFTGITFERVKLFDYGYLSEFWVPVVTASTVDAQFRVAWLVDTYGGAVFVPFWRKYSALDCSPQGLETRIDEWGRQSSLMNLFLPDCCSSTAIAVWSTDCEGPPTQTCVRARVLAW